MAESIDVSTLARDLRQFQVVDVRYPNEWDAGHIEGAVHVPSDYVLDRVGELDNTRPVVTVCRSGSRSAHAAEELTGAGFEVRNLGGGMEAWARHGLPVVATDGRPGTIAEPRPPADDRPAAMQQLQNEFLDVVFAVKAHFGDRDPSDEEIRDFLRRRMIDQGRSPEEADRLLAAIGEEPS